MRSQLLGRWEALRNGWTSLTLYQRFESAVALVLTLVIIMVILVALYRLLVGVLTGLVFGALDPLEHTVFQTVFGEIITLLIALEFNHSLKYVVHRTQSIVQTKILLLIALLAMARKVIILDLQEVGVGAALGLAAIILVLGLTYWLIRERDDRLPGVKSGALRVLAQAGVERIGVESGQPFDPLHHEAIEVRTGDMSEDTVVDVEQPGYLHDGVVLRPARVVVMRRKR